MGVGTGWVRWGLQRIAELTVAEQEGCAEEARTQAEGAEPPSRQASWGLCANAAASKANLAIFVSSHSR